MMMETSCKHALFIEAKSSTIASSSWFINERQQFNKNHNDAYFSLFAITIFASLKQNQEDVDWRALLHNWINQRTSVPRNMCKSGNESLH